MPPGVKSAGPPAGSLPQLAAPAVGEDSLLLTRASAGATARATARAGSSNRRSPVVGFPPRAHGHGGSLVPIAPAGIPETIPTSHDEAASGFAPATPPAGPICQCAAD